MINQKWYKNRNILIIAAVVVIIAIVFIFALTQKSAPVVADDAKILNDSQNDDATTDIESVDAAAYVLCSLPSSGYYGLLPLPAEGSVSYPIHQTLPDGTEVENTLHLTPDGFCMESSTCANQDCVSQGTVTLENRERRVLKNCVICLPNQLMAELYTAEEIAQMQLQESDPANVE